MTDEQLISVVPSERQLRHQKMEFYAFVHFTVNTFTDREWGDGTESPEIFHPARLDADQWVRAVKGAGMTGLILTCKHHDGFCLWPSRYTDHTVAASPWKKGKGDVVREAAEACQRGGIRFGVYLSPWDRHDRRYGSGKPYDDYFVNQLTELLTGYGDIFCVWFDGACGEGPNGKIQQYDWERYYQTIRDLQPDACISVCGPDIRWCGNETGHTRASEWSVVPKRMADTEKVASDSQKADDEAFRLRPISAQDEDLGSREALRDEADLIWYPAEVNTSIRPGWFWHAAEDEQVKPLDKLIDIYEKSVGGNATFLLNIPPTTDGLFHPHDVARLRGIGEYIRKSYGNNLLKQCTSFKADAPLDGHEIRRVLTDDETYYMPRNAGKPTTLTFTWDAPVQIDRIVLGEQLKLSQRVERFWVETLQGEIWTVKASGTVIGHKKIVVMNQVITNGLKIVKDSRCAPAIRHIGVYGTQDFSAKE